MLWQTSIAVIVLLPGGVIGAETAAPLEWKPSILLRASTGELPTRNFSAAREAERVKLLALEQSIATTRAEAEGLRQSDVELRATILALRERVTETQAQLQNVQLR